MFEPNPDPQQGDDSQAGILQLHNPKKRTSTYGTILVIVKFDVEHSPICVFSNTVRQAVVPDRCPYPMHLAVYDRVCLPFQKVSGGLSHRTKRDRPLSNSKEHIFGAQKWGLKYRCMSIWMAFAVWVACFVLVPLVIIQTVGPMPSNVDTVETWSFVPSNPQTVSMKGSNGVIASSQSAETLLNADSLFQEGDYRQSTDLYEEWIGSQFRDGPEQEGHDNQRQQLLALASAKDPNVTRTILRLLKMYMATSLLADAQRWAELLNQAGLLRAEPAYYLCQALREQGEFVKAYHYYLLAASLPLQDASDKEATQTFPALEGMHEYWLPYEESVLWWHVGGLALDRYTHLHGLVLSRALLTKPGLPSDLRQTVYNDLQYSAYALGQNVEILRAEKSTTEEEWRFSTPTFLGNHTLVRVVNYYVSDDGSYHVSKGDKVNTRLMVQEPEEYLSVEWSERFCSTLSVPEGTPSFHHPEAYVQGLEDTRVVRDRHRADTIYTLSASAEYSRDAGIMNQVLGIMDLSNKTLWIQGVIRGPQKNRHDKNWVFAGGLDHVVYDWYPTVQIGSIDVDEFALDLHTAIPSPSSFRDMRGSTNGVLHDHEWWFVTHSVIYRPQQMRKYLHYLVVLNEDLTSISRYSLPFTFERGADVEYCLGLKVDATAVTFGYSVRDRSSRVMTVPWGDIGQLFP